MVVLNIFPVNNKRSRVVLDNDETFELYNTEIRRYKLTEGAEIIEDTYRTLTEEILPKRCKLRAMNLLKSRDYTENALKDKLIFGGYPSDIVDEALKYVKSFGYVDDFRYSTGFINFHLKDNSRKEITYKLMSKGVSKDVIEKAFEMCDERNEELSYNPEEDLIRKQLVKKHYSPDMSYEERSKLMAYFYRKGFESDKVSKVMDTFLQ